MPTIPIRPSVGLLCLVLLGCLSGCGGLPRFPTLEEVGTYLEDHPDDWEAHERYAALMSLRSANDPQVAAHLRIAMRLLAPGWRHDTESRARYLHIERNLLASLGRNLPAAERLAIAEQAFTDRQALPPDETKRLNQDWDLQTHLARGHALADLGNLDKATDDLITAAHSPIDGWEMGKVPIEALREAEDLQLQLATRATEAGDAERATHCREVAALCHDEWTHEQARRDGINAAWTAREQAQAQHDREATEAWEAQDNARRKAESDRVANLVPCPSCHGAGYYQVQEVTNHERADGSTRQEVVRESQRRCNYCLDGWVSKQRAEEIGEEMR